MRVLCREEARETDEGRSVSGKPHRWVRSPLSSDFQPRSSDFRSSAKPKKPRLLQARLRLRPRGRPLPLSRCRYLPHPPSLLLLKHLRPQRPNHSSGTAFLLSLLRTLRPVSRSQSMKAVQLALFRILQSSLTDSKTSCLARPLPRSSPSSFPTSTLSRPVSIDLPSTPISTLAGRRRTPCSSPCSWRRSQRRWCKCLGRSCPSSRTRSGSLRRAAT